MQAINQHKPLFSRLPTERGAYMLDVLGYMGRIGGLLQGSICSDLG